GLPGADRAARGSGDDDVDLQSDELGREGAKPLHVARRVARLEDDVVPFRVAELSQSLPEGRDPGPVLREVARDERQVADAPGPRRGLRDGARRSEQRARRGAKEGAPV